MLELLYHERNPLITTVVITLLKKYLDHSLREKCYKMILFLLRYFNDEIISNTKTRFLYG